MVRRYVPTNVQVQVARDFVDESHDGDGKEKSENSGRPEMSGWSIRKGRLVRRVSASEARIFAEAS
jgi:hypothetical protein